MNSMRQPELRYSSSYFGTLAKRGCLLFALLGALKLAGCSPEPYVPEVAARELCQRMGFRNIPTKVRDRLIEMFGGEPYRARTPVRSGDSWRVDLNAPSDPGVIQVNPEGMIQAARHPQPLQMVGLCE